MSKQKKQCISSVMWQQKRISIIKAVNRKNLHLVYDIYHEYAEHQPLSVIDQAADEIRVVHMAQLRENKRYYLDEEHIPEYEQYWNKLNYIGYQGEWNLECFEGDSAIELKKSMQIMKTVMDNGLQIANNTQQRR